MKTVTKRATEKFANKVDKRVDMLKHALDLQSQIRTLQEELNSVKEFFYYEFEKAKTEERFVCEHGAAILKTTNSYSVMPESIPQLQRIFKDSFNAFVNQKTTYGATAALKKLLADADYKHKDTVRGAVEIKTSNSLVFEPAKN